MRIPAKRRRACLVYKNGMSMLVDLDRLTAGYRHTFDGSEPTLWVRAPGRVNLIGEHTDYNDGFVLPVATEQALHVIAAPHADGRLRVHSADVGHTCDIDPVTHATACLDPWIAYVRGIATVLAEDGVATPPANLYIESLIPLGAGLSSSAAIEVGVGLALLHLAGKTMERMRLADLCQQAEHRFAGTPCGIMDQIASLLTHAGHALLLDCRSRAAEHIPFPSDEIGLLIIDTQVRHELAAGEYARRVAECRAGMAHFGRFKPQIRALRDVTEADLAEHGHGLDAVVLDRCRHVVEENLRVGQFVESLRRRDLQRVGEIAYASHLSLRHLYQVSCHELDHVVEVVRRVPGVFGARMTGGGFGGSVVAFARPEACKAVQRALTTEYDPHHAKPASVRVTKPSAGAAVASINRQGSR